MHGLQGASAELRQAAAEALGELVQLTETDALRPFVVQITGTDSCISCRIVCLCPE